MSKTKIDVTKIPGFEKLDEETKKYLQELEIETPEADYTGYVKKEVFDKKASEAAELSKQLKTKMSEEELSKMENEKMLNEMKEKLENLEKEKTISTHQARFLGLGYDDKTALESATALEAGDMEKVFEIQKSFLENEKKNWEKEQVGKQPGLSKGKEVGKTDIDILEENQLRASMGLPVTK